MGIKLELDHETASYITVTYLEDSLEWWSSKRNWNKDEKEFRREYVAALKAVLKCLK